MDVLSHVLSTTRTRDARHVAVELAGPWVLRATPETGRADLVLVTAGEAVVEADGVDVRLGPGDLAVLPRSVPFVVRAPGALAAAAVPFDHVLGTSPSERSRRVRFDARTGVASDTDATVRIALADGSPPADALLLGTIEIEDAAANPIVQVLPAILPLSAEDAPWIGHTLALVAAETGRLGAEAITARLSEVVLVQAVRTHIEGFPTRCIEGGSRGVWLNALTDPNLGRAILAVNQAPEQPWTVESLAAEAFMSRTSFARQFAQVVGTSPLRYVALWRVYAAAQALRQGKPAFEVAAEVGYRSESSFSKAFKRTTGVSPSEYRSLAARGEHPVAVPYAPDGPRAVRARSAVVA